MPDVVAGNLRLSASVEDTISNVEMAHIPTYLTRTLFTMLITNGLMVDTKYALSLMIKRIHC